MRKGAAQFIPLLILVLVITSFFAISSSSKTNKTGSSTVLSESESGGGSGSSHGGDSNTSTTTSGSSGNTSGTSGETKVESSSTPKPTSTTFQVRVRATEKPEVENEKEIEPPELENENELEVAEGTEEAKIKIGKRENRFLFFEQRFGAESEFPVSVNRTTRELTINTPAGVRTVAVLPDTAVENMLAENVIDRVIGANGRIVEVKVGPDGTLIYEIQGAKDEKFLGLIGVAIPKTVDVSTQNGQLLSVNQSLIDRFLDSLSF